MAVIPDPLVTTHYEYHHGTGKHVLMKDYDDGSPKYSVGCCLSYVLDCFCISLAIGFLVFSGWLCYHIYTNYEGND
jgi:hypothetical protein